MFQGLSWTFLIVFGYVRASFHQFLARSQALDVPGASAAATRILKDPSILRCEA